MAFALFLFVALSYILIHVWMTRLSRKRPRLRITLSIKDDDGLQTRTALLTSANPSKAHQQHTEYHFKSWSPQTRRHAAMDASMGPPADIRLPILFVIAHPDDECMFFGPTVLGLQWYLHQWMKARREDMVVYLNEPSGMEGDGDLHFKRQAQQFLTQPQDEMYLLCLSNGNADGLGAQRELELYRSCQALGFHEDHVVVLDDPCVIRSSEAL